MTTIVIADDHAIVRDGLRQMLESVAAVKVVAEASNGIEAIAAVKTHQPELLFVDISMPYAGGLEVIAEVRQWSPATRVAVFTGVVSFGVIGELRAAEVDGILLKSSPPEELQQGLLALLAGQSFICEAAQRLAADSGSLNALTAREKQILHQLVSGASNADIAARFSISPKTVDNHRTNLMRKLDVHSVGALIRVALREGLLPVEELARRNPD